MKKLVAILTTLSLLLGMFILPVSASETAPEDFVALARPENAKKNPRYDYSYNMSNTYGTTAFVTNENSQSRIDWMSAKTVASCDSATLAYPNRPYGFGLSPNQTNIESDSFNGSYVFTANVKVGDASEETTVPFGANMDISQKAVTMNVQGTDWQLYKAVLSATNTTNLFFGIMDSAAGTTSEIVINLQEGYEPYFAEEAMCDVAVDVLEGSTTLIAGAASELIVEAGLLNQIGLKGNLEQGTFDWQLWKGDKSAVSTALTVEPLENNRAKITIPDNAPVGKYNLIAVQNENPAYVKSLEINVVDLESKVNPVAKPASILANGSPTYGDVGFKTVEGGGHQYTVPETANKTWIPDGYFYKISDLIEPSVSYVFSANLKNLTPSIAAAPLFAVGFGKWNCSVIETTGVSSTELQEYKFSLVAPAGENYLQVGIPEVERNVGAAIQMTSPYLAQEIAADVVLTSDNGSILLADTEESAIISAGIVNQLGEEGNVEQGSFSWYVMDSSDNITDALTITPVSGTNSVMVSADADAAAGVYTLIALSDEHLGFVGEFDIAVLNATPSSAADMPENLLTGIAKGSTGDDSPTDVDGGYKITFSGTNGTWNPGGYYWKVTTINPGASYVFSAKAKNLAADADAAPLLGVGIGEYTCAELKTAVVSSAELEEYTFALTAPSQGQNLQVGIPNAETDNGASIFFNEVYFAEEIISDIVITSDNAEMSAGLGDEINLKASIINQLGSEGNIDQGDIKWYVLNEDKTAVVEGISITDGADNSATLTIGDTVWSGTYVIVAASDKYSGMVEVAELDVEGLEEKVTELELTADSTNNVSLSATVAYTVAGKEIWFAVACYKGNVMEACKLVPVIAAADEISASATVTAQDCTLTGLDSGDVVKAFVWSDRLEPFKIDDSIETTLTIQ